MRAIRIDRPERRLRNLLLGAAIGASATALVAWLVMGRDPPDRPAPPPVASLDAAFAADAGRAGDPVRGADPPRVAAAARRPDAAVAPAPRPPPPDLAAARPPPRPQSEAAAAAAVQAPEDPAADRPKASIPSAEDVKDAVAAAQPAVAGCYEQALAQNPALAGKLVVRFTLVKSGGRGRLQNAEMDDDGVGNPFLGMCVLQALASVEYPAPEGEGELVVRYPFVLEPGPADAAQEEAE